MDCYIYAVEKSLDSYKFNLLQNKQVFINQLKSRNLAARTIDEGAIDENGGGNFSEYVAILSGNDDLLEKAKQDKKLAVLESERQAYHRNKGNAKGKLNENTAGMPLKISGFVIVGSNSLQLIAIYHLPTQAYLHH